MISVCIATYNGAAYLRPQLESICKQLHPGDEIVLSDDHSTDDTIAVAQTVATTYGITLTSVLNPHTAGYVSNFENALRYAKGEYIFLADQDDIWLDHKVERCLTALQEADIIAHDAIVVDEQLQPLRSSYYAERPPYHSWLGTVIKFAHLGCCMCFRRKVLQRALPFPAHRQYCTHDNWLFLIGHSFFNAKILHEPLLLYRRHTANTSAGGTERKSWLFRLNYRLYLLWQLLQRSF